MFFNKGDNVRVVDSAPFWGGRQGYFNFLSESPSGDIAVVSSESPDQGGSYKTLFAVKLEHLRVIREP